MSSFLLYSTTTALLNSISAQSYPTIEQYCPHLQSQSLPTFAQSTFAQYIWLALAILQTSDTLATAFLNDPSYLDRWVAIWVAYAAALHGATVMMWILAYSTYAHTFMLGKAVFSIVLLFKYYDGYTAHLTDRFLEAMNHLHRTERRLHLVSDTYRRFPYKDFHDKHLTTKFPEVDRTIVNILAGPHGDDYAIDNQISRLHGSIYRLHRRDPARQDRPETQSGAPPEEIVYTPAQAERDRDVLERVILPKLLRCQKLSRSDLTLLGSQRYSKAALTHEIEFFNDGNPAPVNPSRVHLYYREQLKLAEAQATFFALAQRVKQKPRKITASSEVPTKQDHFDKPPQNIVTGKQIGRAHV